MSQVRLSIPFVGGLTKVYEQQEFNKEMKAIAEKAKWTSLVVVGLGLIVAEVVTRKTADVLYDTAEVIHFAGNKVLDVHDDRIVAALKKNSQDKIDHAYKLADETEHSISCIA